MPKISTQQTVTITDQPETATAIVIDDQVLGEIIVPAGSSITTLTFYVSNSAGGTYVVANDVGTAGALTVAAGKAQRLPLEIMGAAFLKLVGNAAGTVHLNLKS